MKIYRNPPVKTYSPAKIIATISNPCILSIVMLVLIAFIKNSQLSAAFTQTAVLVSLFVILPLLYVFFRTDALPDKTAMRTDPTLYLKRHPLDVMILGIICGPFSWAILKVIEAPAPLLDTLLALLITAFLAAIINFFYRISFHVSAIMVLVYMAVVIWGPLLWILLASVPPIAWAKHSLHDHSYVQMALGTVLAVSVTTLVVQLI